MYDYKLIFTISRINLFEIWLNFLSNSSESFLNDIGPIITTNFTSLIIINGKSECKSKIIYSFNKFLIEILYDTCHHPRFLFLPLLSMKKNMTYKLFVSYVHSTFCHAGQLWKSKSRLIINISINIIITMQTWTLLIRFLHRYLFLFFRVCQRKY